jgi:hypothetical protein
MGAVSNGGRSWWAIELGANQRVTREATGDGACRDDPSMDYPSIDQSNDESIDESIDESNDEFIDESNSLTSPLMNPLTNSLTGIH